jgi:hypothetical protein
LSVPLLPQLPQPQPLPLLPLLLLLTRHMMRVPSLPLCQARLTPSAAAAAVLLLLLLLGWLHRSSSQSMTALCS